MLLGFYRGLILTSLLLTGRSSSLSTTLSIRPPCLPAKWLIQTFFGWAPPEGNCDTKRQQRWKKEQRQHGEKGKKPDHATIDFKAN